VVKHVYIELDENTHLKLKAKAYSEGKTISETVKRLIEKYVNGEITL
jgi:macrodomain Ter protein organizer (MatP/YcbG family)